MADRITVHSQPRRPTSASLGGMHGTVEARDNRRNARRVFRFATLRNLRQYDARRAARKFGLHRQSWISREIAIGGDRSGSTRSLSEVPCPGSLPTSIREVFCQTITERSVTDSGAGHSPDEPSCLFEKGGLLASGVSAERCTRGTCAEHLGALVTCHHGTDRTRSIPLRARSALLVMRARARSWQRRRAKPSICHCLTRQTSSARR